MPGIGGGMFGIPGAIVLPGVTKLGIGPGGGGIGNGRFRRFGIPI